MTFIGIIIIIVLVYYLIIRPLTQRNRPQIYEPKGRNYNDYRRDDYYGPGRGGFGGIGSFAGGMAAGALLTYLFEHNRIGYDQYMMMQNLEDHEIMRELMDQNIIQQDEIDQLQEEFGQDEHDGWDNDPNQYDDQDNQQDDNSDDWDSGGDDNWA